MQQFLTFWNTYNVTIIEVLIAIIILTVAFLVYTLAFGKKDEGSGSSAAIEKTLQKILEAQSAKAAASSGSVLSETMNPGAMDELTRLRASLAEKDAKIEEMLNATQSEAGGSSVTATKGTSGEVTTGVDVGAFEARIKELEGNLAEYEIISEDIADLSRYKEENSRLQNELDTVRGGAQPAAVSRTPAAEVMGEPVTDVTVDAAIETAPLPVGEAPVEEPPSEIDNELMNEFAAAVEGQTNPAASKETDKLMNDFESFMKKG